MEKFENVVDDRFIQLIELSLRCGLDLHRPFCVEAIAVHYFFEWEGAAAARAHGLQALLGEVNGFELFEMLQDRFASVVSLGASSSFGEMPEAFLDFLGKANG